MDIATILTCFNRKEKTTHCLSNLFAAEEYYNSRCVETDKINIVVFLTNDGCTDGTPAAVQDVCVGHELHIINGDGNCYWAGGMRMAWNKALKHKNDWDFYLLLNDDTFMENDCFISLLKTHKYSINTYGKPGIYSGITCDTHAKDKITYGGYVWTNYFLGRDSILLPTGMPQKCDMANSNIMLVSRPVVEAIGIFHDGFIHGYADFDYSMQAIKKSFPVLVTEKICGSCDYDHDSEKQIKEKISGMNLKQRKEYFKNPLHSNYDVMLYNRRNILQRYILSYIGRIMNLYVPRLYYFASDIRNK